MITILDVRCPQCGTPPGEECRSVLDGREVLHEARVRAAEKKQREENVCRPGKGVHQIKRYDCACPPQHKSEESK